MTYDSRFGPAAQTPQQRAYVLRQLQCTFPQLAARVPALTQQLFDRYVAGELSWGDVRRALDQATPEPPAHRQRRGA